MNIMEMLKSKKFKVAMFSVLAIVCAACAEQITWGQAASTAVPIIAVYLGAQGLADFGKESTKEIIKNDTTPTVVGGEKTEESK